MQERDKSRGEKQQTRGQFLTVLCHAMGEERGLAARCDFEAPEICNEKFKLQERGGGNKEEEEEEEESMSHSFDSAYISRTGNSKFFRFFCSFVFLYFWL